MFKCLLSGVLISLIFIAGCERNNQARFFGLSTMITVEVQAKPKKAEQFVLDLQALTDVHQLQYYAWGQGELNEINNHLANNDCAKNISPDMMSLFTHSKKLNANSEFLFEPAIAPLVEVWGFHDASKMTEQIPDEAVIQEILNKLVSMQNLEYSHNEICPAAPTKIDFGAIGKGWTAAKAMKLISDYKIENILVDFGGDIILKGHNNNKQAWKIGLRDPDQQAPPARIELQTEGDVVAVFTSGDYERMYIQNGQRFHHILDPRTGYPANKLRSVTVVHNDPVKADAAATALFIAGTEWKKIARSMSIENVLVIFPGKKVEITQSLQDKTVWLDTTYQINIIEPLFFEK